jgi:biotin synthase
VGLGETEKEIVDAIFWCTDSGIYPSLFAFTPIGGTALEDMKQPPIESYRRIQLARHLIVQGKTRYEIMEFDEKGKIVDFGISKTQLRETISEGLAFCTSGCPGCNRPYYNESPGGLMYNFPRPPLSEEINEIKEDLKASMYF